MLLNEFYEADLGILARAKAAPKALWVEIVAWKC